jgi:putative endonuclease
MSLRASVSDVGEAISEPAMPGFFRRRNQTNACFDNEGMNDKKYYVYITSNKYNTVLYTGVTGNLKGRIFRHRKGKGSSFTSRYRVEKLVYYEVFGDIEKAIGREKKIKGSSRAKKIELIERRNSSWADLYNEVCEGQDEP